MQKLSLALTTVVSLAAGQTHAQDPPPGPPPVTISDTVDVNIVNGLDNPVPVLPPSTPFWQGIPKTISDVVLQRNDSGFFYCEESYVAEPGKVLLLHTLSGRINVDPQEQFGSFSVRVKSPLPDGQDSAFSQIRIPAGPTAPVSQVAGLYDAYSGSMTLPGLPVVAIESCLIGVDAALGISLVGFEVDRPTAQ